MSPMKKTFTLKWVLFILVLAVYTAVLLVNYGFIAADEYWDAITRYIPAQTSSLKNLVTPDDVKSPLQILPFHAVAQGVLNLGVEAPFQQYQLVILILGLLGILICLASILWLSREQTVLSSERRIQIAMGLFAFHFAMPGIITRPMFESMAVPWMTLAAISALIYDQRKSLSALLIGVVGISVAFTMRQQTGICALVFLILPVFHRRWLDLLFSMGTGGALFLLAGVPDIFLRGRFHFSLFELIRYNIQHGSEYISQPWYFFFPLIFIFMFGPWLTMKYPRHLLSEIGALRSLVLMLALFVFEHMLFANKWERFLFSVFPLMLFILVPFLEYLLINWRRHKMRTISLFVFNFMLWPLASFSPAQKNIIDLAVYLEKNPNIKTVINVNETLIWIPTAFIARPLPEILSKTMAELTLTEINCHTLVVVQEKIVADNSAYFSKLSFRVRFAVNWIDSLAFRLNPERNKRRSHFVSYGCGSK